MYIDYKACLSSFARDPVKCRLPPTYSPVVLVELVRFVPGQPEPVASGPSRPPVPRPPIQLLQGPIPAILPLAPPGVNSKGAPPPTLPGPIMYSQPKGPSIGPPPGAISYGNVPQYPTYMMPEDEPSSNGVPPHKKRKLPSESDGNVAQPPPHKRPISSRTPPTTLPAMPPHAVETPNHFDHFLGGSHIIPGQSQPMYSPSRGHRPRSPPPRSPSHGQLNNEYSHDPLPNMAPPGPPMHSYHPTNSSTSHPQPYANGHSRPSGPLPPREPHSPRRLPNVSSGLSSPASNEVPPPSAPPQGIRKVKLVVRPQDKPAGEAPLPPE